ncbi:MAG: hypothetical protein IJX58_03235 [Clostridia bacterium]|nr:hypothetical protein [Clostridia bacterium]
MKTFAIILLITLAIAALGVGYVFNFVLPETPDVPDHEHVYGEWENRTPATCEEAGEDFRKCECGEEETRKVDALGHDYSSEVTAPTCTEAGYTTYTCSCGKSYVGDEVAATGHSYGEWATKTPATCTVAEVEVRKCACGAEETREGDAATGHTAISIAAALTKTDAMKHDVLVAGDFAVTATCTCGAEYTVTDGITLENATLTVEGDNLVTVKLGELSSDVTVNAAKFNKVVNGVIVDDTHINSGNNTSNYVDRTELYIYNTGMYRVFFRFNFSDVLNSQYYADFGEEAIVKFTFTVTNGVDLTGLPVTFKSYLTSELRSSVDFSELTWQNYSNTYTLGWGSDENPNNTVSLLAKETVGNRATYADGKLVITVTMRELEGCIDENGNAIFVLLTAQKDVKPFVASMENEEFDAPSVQVIFSEDHAHAYIEQVADEKYLASANCEEKAKYYYSCSCGLAGTATFEHGEVIEHSFGEWETKTAANCLDAEVEVRKCACGKEETQNGDPALGHDMQTKFDETNHWTKCSRCDEATEAVAHFGGTATETEQAVCEGCNQPYGGLATHEHSFSEWQTRTDATCTDAEVEFRKCACGVEETQTGDPALGHDMQTKFDETNHWTKCSRCDEATEAVAHFGGTATETEKAVCEGCGQSYGELKEAEKQEYVINGAIVEDTYVNTSTSYRDSIYSDKNFVATYKDSARAYFKFDFSNIINSEDFDENDTNAKIQFVFAACKNPNNSYKYIPFDDTIGVTFAGFAPGEGTTGVGFNTLSYNSIGELHWTNGTGLVTLLSGKTVQDKPNNISISEDGATLTLTFTYAEIKQFIGEDGLAVFTFRSSNIKPCIATMENTTYAIPEVRYIYEK